MDLYNCFLFVSRLIFSTFTIRRQNNESIMSLKQLTPNQKVPLGLLSKGPEAIKKGPFLFILFRLHSCHTLNLYSKLTAIEGFESAKAIDAVNERHPESKDGTKKRRGSRRFSKTGKNSLMTGSSQNFKPVPVDIVIEESKATSSNPE